MSPTLLMNRFSRLGRVSFIQRQSTKLYSSKTKDDVEIPVNPLKDFYSASHQKENGKIYDKKPYKVMCEEGKTYNWCLCGHSKNQPFCDGSHNNVWLKIKLKPIKFTVTKTKEYWLCNCKQTSNRPFCDGTHKQPEIQEVRVV